ncbi:NAD-dependent epimerase/dehydratase family protein [Enterovibrio norvegicus]|uniref:NAD-dependent epimerase/dehydratase family protein n=1 Tax=Enterovibrio norvegicus TaxID=188144 RepID=UPI000C81CCCD|nr:NAD-dependent epimerase/dehydratase family protein [Enterovibrio norvegicus]PMH62419.1 UDP-N-acetylglucosamine 4-epimerase [Enterovibrio norvegicus]
MKVLVIGGSGFIGTRLVELLLKEEKYVVSIFDIKKSSQYPDISLVGDVRDLSSLEVASKNVDVIINLAAEHADNVTPLSLYHDVNVIGAKNISSAALKNNVSKIVFTSSVAIYGLDRGEPTEDMSPAPFNEYGHSKLEAESVFVDWQRSSNSNSLSVVRPSVVFGEGNRGNVFNLISQIESGKFVMIGKGDNKKSMAYVGNVANFLKYQIDNREPISIYNYADKRDLTSNEIVDVVKKSLGKTSKSISLPYSFGLLAGSTFDLISKVSGKKFPISKVRIQKFCADTTVDSTLAMTSGFKAPYAIEDGLKKMIVHDFSKDN